MLNSEQPEGGCQTEGTRGMSTETTQRLMTGIISDRSGATYRITTSKNLRVGDEVMVSRYIDRNINRVMVVTPSEAKRMTDQQRMINDVTVMTVAKVDQNTKRVHLHGEAATIDISRTTPCVVRVIIRAGA
jgi:hypothetical protein